MTQEEKILLLGALFHDIGSLRKKGVKYEYFER
jgi:HD superfamily phosphodiesterase